MGLSEARLGDWEYKMLEKPAKRLTKIKQDDKIEGLISNPEAAQPPDSEMLFYSTETYDFIKASRKENVPR